MQPRHLRHSCSRARRLEAGGGLSVEAESDPQNQPPFPRHVPYGERFMMREFNYQPLKTSVSFRLATLHGGQWANQISLTVQEYQVKTWPPYTALSYEWGCEQEKEILLNGIPFRIRTNLHDFLQVLRPASSESRLLFIDAVCMNQADLEERAAQVSLMRDIFEGAEEVLAWLGRDSVESDVVADACQVGSLVSGESAGGFRRFRIWGEVSGHPLESPDMEKTAVLHHSALEVLQRWYWTRMWMMPELMLAETIRLYCGPRSFAWDRFARVLSAQVPELYHDSTAARKFRAVADIRGTFNSWPP